MIANLAYHTTMLSGFATLTTLVYFYIFMAPRSDMNIYFTTIIVGHRKVLSASKSYQ